MFKTLLISSIVAFAVSLGVSLALQESRPMAFHDDLEAFRECVQVNDGDDARATIAACQGDLATWRESPTFSKEWHKLMAEDAQVRSLVEAYNKEAGK